MDSSTNLKLIRSLSVVIPAYNEVARLPATIRRIAEYLDANTWDFREILVVNDGSRDGTRQVTEALAREIPCLRIVDNPGNRGKGYSVRNGMLGARGDWRLFSDADLSAPIEELEKLAHAVEEQNVPIAIGSRALDRSLIGVHQSGFRESAGRVFNAAMRLVTGLRFHDTQCGFKLFRADVACDVFSRQLLERFGFDVEVLYIADRRHYRIAEVPVRWNHVEAESKVSALTGLHAFSELLEVRMNSLRGRYNWDRPVPEYRARKIAD